MGICLHSLCLNDFFFQLDEVFYKCSIALTAKYFQEIMLNSGPLNGQELFKVIET